MVKSVIEFFRILGAIGMIFSCVLGFVEYISTGKLLTCTNGTPAFAVACVIFTYIFDVAWMAGKVNSIPE